MELAWTVANLSRAARLPRLADILTSTQPEEPQSADQQQMGFTMLAALWGAKKVKK